MRSRLFFLSYAAFCSAAAVTSYPRFAGFANLKKLVVFGDSYSTYNFKVDGPRPSAEDPFGEHGQTRANGPNWVQWLTTRYNESAFVTFNMARGGASVDQALVETKSRSSLVAQLNSFLEYEDDDIDFEDPSTTLVASWFGINDVLHTFTSDNRTDHAASNSLYDEVIDEYTSQLERLYERGANHLLLINLPPMQRAPASAKHRKLVAHAAYAVDYFNEKLSGMKDTLQQRFTNSTVYWYDVHSTFNAVIDDPSQFEETAVYKDTKTWCKAYEDGTPTEDTKLPECEYAANEYLWFNHLHPTSPIHQLFAKQISDLLLS